MTGNREYKSDVFGMLMREPFHALEVYNALNGTQYDNPEEIQIITLEKGISLSVRNDAAFVIDWHLNIYEHQSTYNPNMPLRGLIYFVNTIEKGVRKQDIFSRKRIRIPTPHFVVFYNGREERPEKEELYLSDSFAHPATEPELEVKCTVYNINPGYNEKRLRGCKVLNDYIAFIEKVRNYLAFGEALSDALEKSIDACIKEGILEEFLREHRAEVTKMMTLDYTWERREELIRAEEKAEGMQKGRLEGRQEGQESEKLASLKKLIKNGGMTLAQAMDILEIPTEEQVSYEEKLKLGN